jgi:LuxR family transcriptional regulator, maltose regulon positive regulatory protein
MVEPPATTPAAATAASDALLATKLHIPPTRPGFVARPQLTDRLTKGTAGAIVLVCAPAGFGKTSLLADWARRDPRPVAWLSLDDADNDPARFWRHVVATLEGVRPEVGERLASLLGPPAPRSFEGLVTALLNQLAAQPEEMVLVLDDYHLIDAPPVHQSLGFLLEHLPPQVRLVVASRADPPLPLARLRASGQLAELRQRDLRFTPQEATTLLRTAVGPELPAAAVAVLADRTEGWVAGLQLAALSLQGRTDMTGFVAGFSGSHRYVLDYLAEEVLDRQPEPLREFLLETSVLERLCGPLCDAVTGRADSQQVLERVERANLFLVPLDEVRGWWRYHQLFADLLQARLERERPDRVAELHRSAAAWSERHGLADDAIRHALAAEEGAWAARLIEQHFDAVFRRAEDATLRRWLRALPAELARARPRLCLAEAYWAVVIDGRMQTTERLLEDAERALAAGTDEPYQPSVGRAASLVANVPAAIAVLRARVARLCGDPERTIAFGQQALANLTDADQALRAELDWYLAAAEWLGGRLLEAERALADLVARQQAAGQRYLAIWPRYELGQALQARGQLGAALRTYEQALEVASDPGRALPAAGIAHAGMAEVLYQRSELDAALRHATDGIGLCRQLAYGLPLAIGLVTLARIRQAHGDQAGTLQTIRRPSGSSRAPRSPACSIPCRRSRPACCSPKAGSPMPSTGRPSVAWTSRTSRATRASAST